jgi:hypothetical protein
MLTIPLDGKHQRSDNLGMKKLAPADRARILHLLCEGSSIRAVTRLTGTSKNTVIKLMIDAGKACAAYHDEHVRGVKSQRVQCDEIWSFCYAKAKSVPTAKRQDLAYGDVWTWTAIDADSKLILSWQVGGRDADYALGLMDDLRQRLANRVQLTTESVRCRDRLCPIGEALWRAASRGTGSTPLQPIGVRRFPQGQDHWQSRSEAHLDELQRAPQPHDPHGDAAVHQVDQCFLEKARKPRALCRVVHDLLQFRAHPFDATDLTRDGSWCVESALGSFRYRSAAGSRRAEAGQARPLQEARSGRTDPDRLSQSGRFPLYP